VADYVAKRILIVATTELPTASAPRLPAARHWRRWLGGLVLLVVLLEILWLVAANLALNTGALQTRISHRPEKLQLQWRSGKSWVPWRIQLQGVKVRGQGRRDQWYGEAQHADLRVRLRPLLSREVDCQVNRLSGVVCTAPRQGSKR
jgi:hypothetical protein